MGSRARFPLVLTNLSQRALCCSFTDSSTHHVHSYVCPLTIHPAALDVQCRSTGARSLCRDNSALTHPLHILQRPQLELKLRRQPVQVARWDDVVNVALALVALLPRVADRSICIWRAPAASAVAVATRHAGHRVIEDAEAAQARVVALQRLLRLHLHPCRLQLRPTT